MSDAARAELYTTAEAAAYLKIVSKSWLEHERAAGRGPATVRMGRKVVYLRADLDEFINAQRSKPGVAKWVSTNGASTIETSGPVANTSGGSASRSRAKSSEKPRAQQIADELRKKSAACAPTTKPSLHVVAKAE